MIFSLRFNYLLFFLVTIVIISSTFSFPNSQTVKDITFPEEFEANENINNELYDATEASSILDNDTKVSEAEVEGAAIRFSHMGVGRLGFGVRRVGILPRLAVRRRGALIGFRRFRQFIIRRYADFGFPGIWSFSFGPYNYCQFYPYFLTQFCRLYFPTVVSTASQNSGLTAAGFNEEN
ncbi:hypothetical protein G9A89_002928 [Geosiphon pyriformis]|nr:hypothetical protein G9A89_002928 [Geosiphon pyriformis]